MKKTKSTKLQQVSDVETAAILDLAREILQAKIPGDITEFGCYRGDTSLLIERLLEREFPNSPARLWLYDSFEGLPERTKSDASAAGDAFTVGELFVTKREVVERFKKAGLRIPRIRKGFFENLDPGVKDSNGRLASKDLPEQICLAFLDGDLYQSIKTSLTLVEPRISKGGIIIVHDYNNPQLPGVAKAVDEWLYTQNKKAALKFQRRESLATISF